MRLAGLDIGTSGCKITVFEPCGAMLGTLYRDYPVSRTASEHEIDVSEIWRTVCALVTDAAAKYGGIAGIGVASFGETFVLLDGAGSPLCNSMIYTDPRGEEECLRLERAVGEKELAEITGLKAHAMYSVPKLMWIKNNRPELYNRAAKILFVGDYIVYMLTGKTQIDYSLASRTMAFDINTLEWSAEVMRAADIDMELFSAPVAFGTSAGPIRGELADKLGLARDVVVVSGGHDQVAAAVGCGVFDSRTAVDGAGSVECITPVFSLGAVGIDKMTEGSYSIVPYVEPGKYVCYAFLFTGGALLQWFADTLAGYAAAAAQKRGVSVYDELEGGEPLSGPTGILVLPHFSGAATPYMDYGSKGAIAGLTLTHTQRDIFYAMMEGVCFEMRLNTERLSGAGIKFGALRAAGGGANSRAWMQMKADILNMPVVALQSAEAGAAGCAMAAGTALGLFADLRAAAGAFVKERETYYPRAEMREKYGAIYEKYKKLYAAIRPLV